MTDRDELVEQVARAIIRRRAETGDDLGPGLAGDALNRYVDGAWRYWQDDACAAILATLKGVREPSAEACAEGEAWTDLVAPDDAFPNTPEFRRGEIGTAFTKMIDRLIKDFEA